MRTQNNLKQGLLIDMLGALIVAAYFGIYLIDNSVGLVKASIILLVSFSAVFYSIFSAKRYLKLKKEMAVQSI
jgi:hypothetical protein